MVVSFSVFAWEKVSGLLLLAAAQCISVLSLADSTFSFLVAEFGGADLPSQCDTRLLALLHS